MRVTVVGGGVFGLSSALALRQRGHEVVVLDAGAIPRPESSSSDRNKAVRIDYGRDRFHAELADRAIDGWHRWNAELGELVYREEGVLILSQRRLEDGGFEADSMATAAALGRPVERLTGAALGARIPALATGGFVDGYYNPRGGWVRSARTVELLAARAAALGVELRPGVAVAALRPATAAVVVDGGATLAADVVVLAAGAWSGGLLGELGAVLTPRAQPCLHLAPADPALFRAPRFAMWCGDIQRTGFYGFPADDEGVVKIGHHGAGFSLSPDASRQAAPELEPPFRTFLAAHLPALAAAPRVALRLCWYCDSADGRFWIDRHPIHDRLIVATGGSGHGMKFAPWVGPAVADLIERRRPALAPFAWRTVGGDAVEDARYRGRLR